MTHENKVTITFTATEARAVEAQLKQIEDDRDANPNEPLRCVRDELDRLESARIRFTQAIQETYK